MDQMLPLAPESELKAIAALSFDSLARLKNKKIFITGGTGFFGKWLMQSLLHMNKEQNANMHFTLVCRNTKRSLAEQSWLNSPSVKLIQADLKTYQPISEAFDFFIHAATSADAKLNQEQPEEMCATILDGTLSALKQARVSQKISGQISPFLLTSSGAVYGRQNYKINWLSEDQLQGPDITDANNAYAEAKRLSELYCQFANHRKEIDLKIARCFAFCGPYLPLDTHFAVGNFLRDALSNKTIVIKGDGSPQRTYMHPVDLIPWLLKILTHGQSGLPYNVGSDEKVTIGELAESVLKACRKVNSQLAQKPAQILGAPMDPALRNDYTPSIARAQEFLQLKLTYDLDKTLKATADWLHAHGLVKEIS